MADDTRLAEACLLLNYSNQSYKEQMLMINKQQLQHNQLGNDQHQNLETIVDNCNQLNEKNVSSKLITPPPEQDYIIESQESTSFSRSQCLESPPGSEITLPCNLFTDDRDKFDNFSYEHLNVDSNKLINTYSNNYCEPDREPINNLLAAVNCALPGLRSRPTILQRPTTAQIQSSETLSCSTNHLPDHDYCHQQQQQQDISRTHQANELTNMIDGDGAQRRSNQGVCLYPNPTDSRFHSSGSKRKQDYSCSLNTDIPSKALKLVAVHLGAGHSHHDEESLNLAKKICEQVMLQTSCELLFSNPRKKRKNTLHPHKSDHDANALHPNGQITAESAVVHLIKLMEDHQALNCGYGSNLNIKGQVECDASLMSDRTQMWAGVGAISGCRNPILLAKSLYDHQTVPRPLELTQPNLLVGSGAKQWMREHCPYLSVMDSKMVSSKAFSTYQKLKSKHDVASKSLNSPCQQSSSISTSRTTHKRVKNMSSIDQSQHCPVTQLSASAVYSSSTILDHGFYCATNNVDAKRKLSPECSIPDVKKEFTGGVEFYPKNIQAANEAAILQSVDFFGAPTEEDFEVAMDYPNDCRLDTVGAIAVDINNNFASAISSGGILLKYKGRLGQAAVPGAGCWSEDSVAVTTSGVGEYLTLSVFAKKFYDKMQTLRLLYDLGHVEKKPDLSGMVNTGIEECFEDLMSSPALAHVDPQQRLAGMLAVSTINSKKSPDRVDNKDLYLSYAHNTNSMCVGYMTCDDIVAHSVMSRQDRVQEIGDNERGSCEPVVNTVKFSLDIDSK